MLFKQTVCDIGDYVFIHTTNEDQTNTINLDLKYNNLYIYHPNKNYYDNDPQHKYYSIWSGTHNNITSYATIIENASQIYLVDDSYFYLANYLNLKAKIRIIYTSNINRVKEYMNPNDNELWTIKLIDGTGRKII